MYGAIPVGSIAATSDVVKGFNAGGTFAANDTVMFSSGELVVGTATSSLLGIALEAATSASTDVKVNMTPGLRVIMDNDQDSDTFAVTDVGLYGDLVGATGVQQINTDTISSTPATFFVLEFNPQGFNLDTDTSIGLFTLHEQVYP